jgi:transposase
VVLANPKAVKGITRAGAKTDKIDARTLAKLLAGGFLPAVWLPDEQTRIVRREGVRLSVCQGSRSPKWILNASSAELQW